MKKLFLFQFILIIYFPFAQGQLRINGTRLSFQLPSDFYLDNKASGIISKIDSSSIHVFELNIPQTFEVWTNDQISRILSNGLDTFNCVRTNFNGYKSIQFFFSGSNPNDENYLILFGKDSLQNFVLAKYKKQRRNVLVEALKKAKYDNEIKYDYYEVIGFEPQIKNSNLKLVSKNAMSIRYEERNENNELASYLTFVKSAKTVFANMDSKDIITYFADKYYPNREFIKDLKLNICDMEPMSSIFKTNHGSYDEYNIISIMFLADFDILIMSGVNNLNKLDSIIEDIKLLKTNF